MPIIAGDAMQPGSLLQPGEDTVNHSITILLPDGQRILYECFTAEDCARGFRVPSLYRTPAPFAVDMLARIQAVLAREPTDTSTESSAQKEPGLPRDEVVAVLDSGNRVHVAGLAAHLPNGRYTYDLRPLDGKHTRQFRLLIEKRAPSITLSLPSSGLYIVTIADDLNTPRIDLFIAAVEPAQAASFSKSFSRAKVLMKDWNGDYAGWPIHDFQRAYLRSLMLDAKPLSTRRKADATGKIASNAAGSPGGNTAETSVGGNEAKGAVAPARISPLDMAACDPPPVDETRRDVVAAEPMFFPRPGLFNGDTAVTLRCDTPGATMHYTVDGSQPVASSPVYGAPIMVKGTELTIKSFASAAGRKDSAVVTGIFRIRQWP
ncbi:MAG: chitobiase/beta-hexosaminidase C-terminal domain-containing protein [Acidobacteriaceae bacterium]